MQKKYLILLLLSSLLLLLIFFVSYLIDNVVEVPFLSLETTTNLASILAAIPTLIVALLLYRRFSGTQLLVDKQTEEVMSLIEYLSRMYFGISNTTTKKNPIFSMTNIYLDETHVDGKNFREYIAGKYKKYKFVADNDTKNNLDYLMDLSFSVYMPTTIAKILDYHFNRRNPWWLDSSETKKFKQTMEFSVDTDNPRVRKDKPDFHPKYLYIDILELSNGLTQALEASLDWMRDNNTEVFKELNIKKRND